MPLTTTPDEIELWPAADEDRLWEAGLQSQHVFVLAVGWAGVHYVPRSTLTHAAVDGLTSQEQVPAEPGGLDVASATMPDSEAMTQEAPSPARPHLTIAETAPSGSVPTALWGAGLKDLVLGRSGEDLAPTVIHIEILIVTSDDQVLVVDSDKGVTLPRGVVRRQESPGTACKRIARESLGLQVSRATPLWLFYSAKSNSQSMIFHCWLTSDHAQVRPQQRASVALRSLDDEGLPDIIKDSVDRLEAGVEDPANIEY